MTDLLTVLTKTYPETRLIVLQGYVEPLQRIFQRYDISTINRQAAFIAQTGHESGGFNHRVENLNYSAKGLRSTFPKYFPTDALANAYARQPEKIANRVYANRMGNGDEASGDGWKFRGKGLIQLTGRANTKAFAMDVNMSINDALDYLLTLEGAVDSAGWFWSVNKLNAFADRGDMLNMTKRINGGTNGLQDRATRYSKARLAML